MSGFLGRLICLSGCIAGGKRVLIRRVGGGHCAMDAGSRAFVSRRNRIVIRRGLAIKIVEVLRDWRRLRSNISLGRATKGRSTEKD